MNAFKINKKKNYDELYNIILDLDNLYNKD